MEKKKSGTFKKTDKQAANPKKGYEKPKLEKGSHLLVNPAAWGCFGEP